MSVSRGKDFEKAIRNALSFSDVSLDRFPDPMAGYAGVRNFCDFCCYYFPFLFYFECKSIQGNYLNFSSIITRNQWEGLLEKAKIPGVIAGYLVWFRDHDITVFMSAEELERIKKTGAHSVNIKNIFAKKIDFIELLGKKKRVLFEYEGKNFLQKIKQLAFKKWIKQFTNER